MVTFEYFCLQSVKRIWSVPNVSHHVHSDSPRYELINNEHWFDSWCSAACQIWSSRKFKYSLTHRAILHLPADWSTMWVVAYMNRLCTSEAADFDGVERSSLQARVPWVDWTLPFAQTTGELQLVCGEDVAYQVAQQPSAVFLGGVDGLVPLLVSDEKRIILQQLFTALQGGQRCAWSNGLSAPTYLL